MDIKGFKGRDGTVHKYDYEALANKPEPDQGSGGNADQSGGNGLSSTEKTLMLSLFKNSIFATDMTSTIAQLEAYWNGSGGNEGGGDTGGDSGEEPGGDTPPVVETLPPETQPPATEPPAQDPPASDPPAA